MKKHLCLLMAVLLTAAGLGYAGCANKSEKGGGAGETKEGAGQRGGGGKKPKIKTAKAEVKTIILKREYIGDVLPAYSVDIKSAGSGRLKSLLVDIGTKVVKGQELAIVDQEEMRAQKEQAEAQGRAAEAQGQQAQAQNQLARAGILAAESSEARAEADLEQARNDEARAEGMFDKGYISRSSYENAKTTVKKFKAALSAANAQLAQANAQLAQSNAQLSQTKAQLSQVKAQVKSAQVKLDYLTVRAPFSGVVAEKYVDAGAYVSPTVGIIKLVNDDSVKVVINALEEDVTRVSIGAEASVVSDAWPNRVFKGKVSRVSPVVEPGSRTGAVEILVGNESRALRPGMMARVNLVTAKVANALIVPADAVIIDQKTGGKYVMTMEGKKPRRNDVRVGIQSGEDVEIVGGIKEGAVVVVGALPVGAGMGGGEKGGGEKGKSAGKGGGGK